MKKLLFAQYIDYANEKNRTTLIILNLLHELRVMTLSQMTEMINLDFKMNKSAVAQQLSDLAKAGFVEKIRFGKEMCYYLTKLGHQSIGGVYTIPKVPEYNLHHYLAINCYLIQVMRLLKDHPRLKRFVSERRQVYEAKDFNKENKGVKYFVADFQAVFKGEGVANEIIWYFEIELTMKTLRRYQNGIFPKYVHMLEKKENDQLFYVTPNVSVKENLSYLQTDLVYTELTNRAQGKTKMVKVGHKEVVAYDWTRRLHLMDDKNFYERLENFIPEAPGINWFE